MEKRIGLLSALLVAQLVLAVVMNSTGSDLAAHRPDTPFLELGDRVVDRITIEGPEDHKVVLGRDGEGWVLPEVGDFPADRTKVDQLLDRLRGLKRGLAVATTSGALNRFKVSDEVFERRVKLFQGQDTLATIYFGTSPGVRRVHARTSQDEAVYSTELGAYEAPAKPEDWQDKGLLRFPVSEVESMRVPGLTLTSTIQEPEADAAPKAGTAKPPHPSVWKAAGLGEDETVDQANSDALAEKLAALTIGSVLGTEAKPEYGLDAPALTLDVQRNGSETIEYRLGKREKEKDYVLKVSSRPEYFRLPSYLAEPVIEAAARSRLIVAAPAEVSEVAEADAKTDTDTSGLHAQSSESKSDTGVSASSQTPSAAQPASPAR